MIRVRRWKWGNQENFSFRFCGKNVENGVVMFDQCLDRVRRTLSGARSKAVSDVVSTDKNDVHIVLVVLLISRECLDVIDER